MQTRHLLITLLLAAHVLVGLVVWSVAEFQAYPEFKTRVLILLVGGSQVGLLAIWLALGRCAAPWRMSALVAVVVAWSWIWSLVDDDPIVVFIFLPLGAIVVAVLALARLRGLWLNITDVEFANIEDDRPWQFTLARLFAWTTSLALCLGLLSLTFRHCSDLSTSQFSQLPTLILGSTIVTLICLWLTLPGLRRQMFVVLLVVFLFGCGLFIYVDNTKIRFFLVLQIPIIVATLLVFRVAGYRLSWKRKNS